MKSAKVGVLDGTISHNIADQKLYIDFANALPVGEHVLNIKYQGILNDELVGFYRTKGKMK